MKQELINVTIGATANNYNFRSDALNTYSKQIATIGANMSASNIEIAKILARISYLNKEELERDGFKGVGDYAYQTFGIAKGLTSQLIRVAKRFYLADELPKDIADYANKQTPSKLIEIADLSDEQITAHLTAGTIKPTTTQKQLREIGANAKALKATNKPPKPLVNYNCIIVIVRADIERITVNTALEALPAMLNSEYGFTDCIINKRVSGDKSNGRLYIESANGFYALITYNGIINENAKASKVKEQKFTREQLLEMLAKLDK